MPADLKTAGQYMGFYTALNSAAIERMVLISLRGLLVNGTNPYFVLNGSGSMAPLFCSSLDGP
jgi:hypothetical protein